ncbi:50S ribosomal protein L25/general stress protein Ctc [Brachymonas sp. G13]|uniref:50S ribosomal protein L25/general stress protein Ctc n=1 Tax=Brachymonas TaxID=28219 RepID=UPI0016A0B6C3|nr:50S ribosomal protein L25/general stress protein Ctc [Brachymonas sp. J145]MEE1653115.1 50S ribosomal protein L25/general stress protein Ctc [Brachymonas sp. J145]NLX16588.1 50S ribosomal protein L25/general stress protein Ctc [Ramlibacter sp.]
MKVVAFERTMQGTGASRRLRNAGKTPGIVYGGNADPVAIELDHNALWHALKKEVFHSSVLNLEVAGKVTPVLLRDVQYHPYKQLVLHVDFQRVVAGEKLTLKVPLHFVGADESDAVKLDRCTVNHVQNELEIVCLPKDLPEAIVVDLSQAKKGDVVLASQLTLPEGVEFVAQGGETDPVLVTIVGPAGGGAAAAAEGEGEAAAE